MAVAGALCLGGCTEEDRARREREEFFSSRVTTETLEKGALATPSRIIASQDDFVYALDWMAFYRVADEVFFEVEEGYASTFANPYQEFHRAYLAADLADVYACQLNDSYYSELGVVGVRYSMSKDVATEPAEAPDTPILRSFDHKVPAGEGDRFVPWIERADLERVPCETSEQLWWLACHGFAPDPAEGSVAQRLYAAACAVLAERIADSMDERQKVKAVYDFLTGEVYYDYQTAYSTDTYLVREQAYYLEGVLLNRVAVCDGKAKAMVLLLQMLGIECQRVTGVGEGGDHAWNVVRLEDGRWYVCCTTFGQLNGTDSLGCYLTQYNMLLTSSRTAYADDWAFEPQKHVDACELVEEEALDVYADLVGGGSCVRDVGELEALLMRAAGVAEGSGLASYKVEFLYTGDDSAFEDDLAAFLADRDNMNALPIRHERGKAYQVVCLNR